MPGSRTLLDLAHRYGAAGQLAETDDDLAAEGFSLSQTFVYDDLRRLVGHTAAGKSQTWRYSDDGNLLAHAGRTLGYDGERPHAAVTLEHQALEYDAAGQLSEVSGDGPLSAGAWHFDPHGRVQSFTAADGRRVEHVHGYTGERAIRREYDAAGQLAREVLYFTRNLEVRDGKLVRWVYFAGERIAESPISIPAAGFPELPAETLTIAPPPADPRHLLALLLLAFVALALRVLATRPRRLLVAAATLALASSAATLSCHTNSTPALTPDEHTRFHVADRLGSASLVLDHRGHVLTRDAADPYGAPRLAWRADADTAVPTYRFTGKEDDALSGAIAIGARHYLPELGRWASPDPHFLLENPDAALGTPGEANPPASRKITVGPRTTGVSSAARTTRPRTGPALRPTPTATTRPVKLLRRRRSFNDRTRRHDQPTTRNEASIPRSARPLGALRRSPIRHPRAGAPAQ